MPQEFIKDPDALLDYKVDWSNWLGTDTIDSSSWAIVGTDNALTENTTSKTDDSATIWLDGGTLGKSYEVTNRIITAGGREDDRTITVRVLDK